MVCCMNGITQSEQGARLHLLGDIVFNAGYYQWQAILKFHAAILSEIENGNMQWGDCYSKLEQQTSCHSLPERKTIRSGETAHLVINVAAGTMSIMVVTQRKGLCIAVNIKTEIVSIPTITLGNSLARQHKCFIFVLQAGGGIK